MKQGAKALLAAVLAAGLALAGCSGGSTAADSSSSGPAGPCGASGNVNWYTTQDAETAKLLADAFTTKCGVTVELQTTQALPLLQRFQQEQAAGINQADVFSTVGYGLTQTAVQGDLVSPLPAEITKGYPSTFVSPDGYSFSSRVVTIAIAVNSNLVPAGEEPTSWNDLTDPKWAGKIGLMDPTKNSTSYQAFWQLLNDPTMGQPLIDGLAKQQPVLYTTSNQLVQAVETGEKAIAITSDDTAYNEIAKGAPLRVVTPTEGVGTSLNFNMLVKAAPNPAGATALLTFLASKEGAKIGADALMEYSAWPDVPGAPAARPPLADVKLLAVDQAKQATDQATLAPTLAQTLSGTSS